jgi:Uma2 family endonuclease
MPMSTPETIIRANEPIRPLKRIEYESLAAKGFFDQERVELLFGVVVPMTPIDQAHVMSTYRVRRALEAGLGDRAMVLEGSPFAASEISEPEPDLVVVPPGNWQDHASRAYLVVEVSRSSLRRDRGPKTLLYGLAEVDEYWIVDHVHGVVEVHRDRQDGRWQTVTKHHRGETIAPLAFVDVGVAVADILPPDEHIHE